MKSYINFSDQDLYQLEAELLSFQSITLDDMLEELLKEDAIRHGDEEHAILTESMSFGTRHQSIKISSSLHLMRVVLCIIYSNAEESVFSCVKKNLNPQHASLELDETLSSTLSFQCNRTVKEKYYQYKPSEKVVSRSTKVTQEYNQEHSSTNKKTHDKIVNFLRLSKVS